MTKMHANDASEIIFIFHMNMYFLLSYLNSCLVCSMNRDLKNIKVKLKYINFFFVGSHLRLGQWKDDRVVG